ncbi:MAG: T9SS type A sorting domain-containing protein [Bacteroidia bacterium]
MNIKTILVAVSTLAITTVNAQITINRTDMPRALDTVYIGTTTNLNGVDATLTGIDYVWDFSLLTANNTRLDTFVSVTSAPLAYQLFFNNQVTKNSSNVAIKIDDIPLPAVSPIQITNVYGFYKNPNQPVIPIINPNPERLYAQTGFGATVSGLPMSVALDPQYDMDVWYKFPMNYGNQDSCYSVWTIDVPNVALVQERRHRYNLVDGWGSVITPLDTFNCMRVKSYSVVEDSVKLKAGIGASLPGVKIKQYVTEYKWLAKNMREPVLKVTYTSTNPTTLGVPIAEYQRINPSPNPANALRTLNKIEGVTMYYDIASAQLIINNTSNKNVSLTIVDALGREVISKKTIGAQQSIPLNQLTNGIYVAQLQQDGAVQVIKFVKQ